MFYILTAMLVTWLYLFITVQQKRWFLLDVNYISIKRKKIHPMYWKIQKAERLGNLSLGLLTQWKVANQPWLVCCRLYLPSHSSDPVWSHTPKQAKPGSWKNKDPIFFFFLRSYLTCTWEIEKELVLVLCDDLEGWDGGCGGRLKREEIYVYF